MTDTPRTRSTGRRAAAVTSALALGLGLAACGGSDGEGPTDGASNTISIGVPPWEEGIAVSHLWTAILEDEGYDVDMETVDLGVLFTSLAGGGYDVMFDAWLPLTHAEYVAEYGDRLVDLGVWYDDAAITIAVNEDSPAQSIADLATMGDEYGNRLVGIEAGAGQTKLTQEVVVPTYGLENLDYVISSTPAMLAELQSATASGNNVAVTLWRPHWAYDAFPIRDLEDPEGTLGGAEQIHTYAVKDFEERHPELVSLIGAFELTSDQLFSLENMMFNSDEYANEAEAVDAWLEENPTFVDDLKAAADAS